MIQIGVCQWILDRSGVDALHRAAELGFAGIQLGIGDEDTAVALRNPALQKSTCRLRRKPASKSSASASVS